MKLKDYVDKKKWEAHWSINDCAAYFDMSVTQLYRIFSGEHNLSILTAMTIQRRTDHEVTIYDLIPDSKYHLPGWIPPTKEKNYKKPKSAKNPKNKKIEPMEDESPSFSEFWPDD